MQPFGTTLTVTDTAGHVLAAAYANADVTETESMAVDLAVRVPGGRPTAFHATDSGATMESRHTAAVAQGPLRSPVAARIQYRERLFPYTKEVHIIKQESHLAANLIDIPDAACLNVTPDDTDVTHLLAIPGSLIPANTTEGHPFIWSKRAQNMAQDKLDRALTQLLEEVIGTSIAPDHALSLEHLTHLQVTRLMALRSVSVPVRHHQLRQARHVFSAHELPDQLAACHLCASTYEDVAHLFRCPALCVQQLNLRDSVMKQVPAIHELQIELAHPHTLHALATGVLTVTLKTLLSKHRSLHRAQALCRAALDSFIELYSTRCSMVPQAVLANGDIAEQEWNQFLRTLELPDPNSLRLPPQHEEAYPEIHAAEVPDDLLQ
jgi:hypothetical protein